MTFNQVFKAKKILITGHTGFKGSWLCTWLHELGAEVVGVSNDTVGHPSNYQASSLDSFVQDHRLDIRDADKLSELVKTVQPDLVFHLAAQALVRPSYSKPLETLTTNSIGTANVLEAIRGLDKQVAAIIITSDKSYDNVEWVWGYRETDRLGGKDPYSASKGMAELAIRTYVESFFNEENSNIRIGITRAGNVIGGGDWAIDRVVPDCMRAWSKKEIVQIRSPGATRPWQHVLEPLGGYLTLAARLLQDQKYHGHAYNFGPSADQNYPVSKLIDEMSKHWDQVRWQDVSGGENLHEAGMLKLNCDKALLNLSWQAVLSFEDTIKMTVDWYRQYYQNPDYSMHEYSVKQINAYTELGRLKGQYK